MKCCVLVLYGMCEVLFTSVHGREGINIKPNVNIGFDGVNSNHETSGDSSGGVVPENVDTRQSIFLKSFLGQDYVAGFPYGDTYKSKPHFGYEYSGKYDHGFGGYQDRTLHGGNVYGIPRRGFVEKSIKLDNGFKSYNNKHEKSDLSGHLRLSGFPLLIPIPINNFVDFGSSYNSHRSHHALSKIILEAIGDSNNKTSVYIINNSTVLPCTREHFTYDSYNLTIATCTAFNCTTVGLITVKTTNGTVRTNFGSITMCLDPTATLTTDLSRGTLSKRPNVKTNWKSICKHINTNGDFNKLRIFSDRTIGGNSTENINTLSVEQTKETEEIKTSMEAETNSTTISTQQNITTFNSTRNSCIILNCSAVEFCMPKVEILCEDTANNSCNNSVISYTSCIELRMCNSNTSLSIDRKVKLFTLKEFEENDVLTNETFNENVNVVVHAPSVSPHPSVPSSSPVGGDISKSARLLLIISLVLVYFYSNYNVF